MIARNRIYFSLLFMAAAFTACNPSKSSESKESPESRNPGMIWIAGGNFTMGTDDPTAYPHEQPAHPVKVKGFWMDATEVTNAQYKEFVDATGWVTLAEQAPTWEELQQQLPAGTPRPPDSVLVAGALVFTPPKEPVTLNDYSQ